MMTIHSRVFSRLLLQTDRKCSYLSQHDLHPPVLALCWWQFVKG